MYVSLRSLQYTISICMLCTDLTGCWPPTMCNGNAQGGGRHFFYHRIDIAVVKSFILFREHQQNNPDNPALKRISEYPQGDFREEIIRGICGFPDYDDPPVSILGRPPRSATQTSQFVTEHIPVQGEHRRNCVVCYKEGRGEVRYKPIEVHRSVRESICMLLSRGTAFQYFIVQSITFLILEL